MQLGLNPSELTVALMAVAIPWLIGAAIFLIALYFVVRKAVRDELKNR